MSEQAVYEDVRHWFLRPSRWGKDLMHQHHGTWWLCNKRKDGGWYCFKCRTKAPDEIQFIADLAPCWYNYRVDDITEDVPDHLLQ